MVPKQVDFGANDTVLSLARGGLATVADVGVATRDVDVSLLVALFGEDVNVVAAVVVFVLRR